MPKSHPLPRLMRYGRRYRKQVIAATLCSVFNKIFDLAPPLLIGAAVDLVVAKENSLIASWGFEDVSTQLWILAGGTFVIWALESIFQYAYGLLWRNLAQTLQHDLRLDTYSHVQRLDLAYFEERSTGELMSILNDDINQLERFLDVGANDLLRVGTTVVVVGTIFFVLSPSIAWLTFLPIPAIIWGSFIFQRRIAPRYAAVREDVGRLNGLLSNNLGGIATIKAYTAEEQERARLEVESDRYRQSNRRAITLSSAFSPLIRMVIVVGFLLMLVLGARAALEGTLAVGAFGAMVFLIQRLLWPLTELGRIVDLYQRAMASTTRVLDLLDTPIRVRSGEKEVPLDRVAGSIDFAGVTFAYRDGHPVLSDLNLTVPAGDTIAVVGPTGSGKSTIVKLLLRFYEPQEGRITLDGDELRTLRLDSLRRTMGFVSQEVFLFHGTVKENITFGSPEATDEQIIAAARAAEAHEFIESLPEGYDTIVGERGQKLSGGQRQRISIARAVLKNPPILIFDEATSAVDNETEAAIQRSIERIAVGRTTVIIAHRLSTIRHANRVYVIDGGVITEQGTHEELVAAEGTYASLWSVQTGEHRAGHWS